MIDSEFSKFINFLNGCALVYDKELKKEQVQIYWNILKDHTCQDVEKAFNRHIKTSKFFPAPSEIIENIPKSKFTGHIGSDEAWSIAIKSMDETNTVICNEQILKAREIAMDVYNSGDKTGARMAFRDAYNRIIVEADQPKWFVSLGHNKEMREGEVLKAYENGIISHSKAQGWLPWLSVPEKKEISLELKFGGNNDQ